MVWKWLKKEFYEILPVWTFFFIAFALLTITLNVVMGEYDIRVYEPTEYLVASLIVAKSVMLIDTFLKREWLSLRPLIYVAFWNSVHYFVGALVLHYLEQVLKFVSRRGLTLIQASRQTFLSMAEPRFWGIAIWFFSLIFVFCTMRELIRVIGQDRFIELFFRPRSAQNIRKVS